MSRNVWWRISGGGWTGYAFERDTFSALARFMLNGMPGTTCEQIPAEEVPCIERGLREATLEQLRDELKQRGWKLTLS